MPRARKAAALVVSAMVMMGGTIANANTPVPLSDKDLDQVTAGADPISVAFASAVLYSALKYKAVQVAAPIIVGLSSVPPEVIVDVTKGVGYYLVGRIAKDRNAEPTLSPPSSVSGLYINIADYLFQRGTSQPPATETPPREITIRRSAGES